MPAAIVRKIMRQAIVLALLLMAPATVFASPAINIRLAHMTMPEFLERTELNQLLRRYDLTKYTFTNHVIIDQYAVNHSFPVITLNTFFHDKPDALLLSYVHEQLHWYVRIHRDQEQVIVHQLRIFYPKAPGWYPEGAGTQGSTYAHLVVCYLEMQAGRQLIGPKRTKYAIEEIPWYTWIWHTVVKDESTIGTLVKAQNLDIQ